jgi:hypothetical protein
MVARAWAEILEITHKDSILVTHGNHVVLAALLNRVRPIVAFVVKRGGLDCALFGHVKHFLFS